MPVWNPPVVPSATVNVDSYGAVGDGTTDDTTALRAALATGMSVVLPAGTYLTGKLTLGTGQYLIGAGQGVTIIKLKNASNENLVETTGFASLMGTDSTGGPANFGIFGLTLDGNEANQTAGTSHALAIYGLAYHLSQFVVRDGSIYSEWSTSSAQGAGQDSFESFISDFKVHNVDGIGLHFKGPHDTVITDGQFIRCGVLGSGITKPSVLFAAGGASNGTVMDGVHIWGATTDYNCVISGSGITLGPTCQFEGAALAQVYINASRQRIQGKYFAGGDNYMTAAAFKLAAGINNIDFDAKIEDLVGGVNIAAGSITGLFGRVRAQYAGGVAPSSILVGGSLDQHSGLQIISLSSAGVSTGSDFRFPGTFQATNVKTFSFTGNESTTRLDVIPRETVSSGRSIANGELTLVFFTPDADFTVTNMIVESRSGSTGGALVKMGLFRAVSSDLLTCVARTASDTTILQAANTLHTRAIVDNGAATPGAISSVVLSRGLRYAFAVLGVGWTGAPQVGGSSSSFNMSNLFPMLGAVVSGQTDIGATYTTGITAVSTRMWGGLT
jgi:hypothetical protein